jgi:hypothetical protein
LCRRAWGGHGREEMREGARWGPRGGRRGSRGRWEGRCQRQVCVSTELFPSGVDRARLSRISGSSCLLSFPLLPLWMMQCFEVQDIPSVHHPASERSLHHPRLDEGCRLRRLPPLGRDGRFRMGRHPPSLSPRSGYRRGRCYRSGELSLSLRVNQLGRSKY